VIRWLVQTTFSALPEPLEFSPVVRGANGFVHRWRLT